MIATAPAKHPDGFNGARDSSILAACYDSASRACKVQATDRTRDILHRAGFRRVRTGAFYRVKVRRDELDRLQLVDD